MTISFSSFLVLLITIKWLPIHGFQSIITKLLATKAPMTMDPNHTATTLSTNDTQSSKYLLEYSPNFQRHVVKQMDGSVIESYLWLDDALSKYPNAQRLPLYADQRHRQDQCLYHCTNTSGATLCDEECDKVVVCVAGGGQNETSAYPVNHRSVIQIDDVNYNTSIDNSFGSNLEKNCQCLRLLLHWSPEQIEKMLEVWPPLRSYPSNLLEERIRFLIAPWPENSTILQQVNTTEDIDWPRLFYNQSDSRGAGITAEQITYALQHLPDPFLLRLNHNINYIRQNSKKHHSDLVNETIVTSMQNPHYADMVAELYECTPNLVTQMTSSVLDLWVTGVSSLDIISLSFLHWHGWAWQSCRIVLHALPGCHQCSLEPSWDLMDEARNGNHVLRKHLLANSLAYLQIRLQVRPWQIHAMIKTHSRLSQYSASQIQRNLDFLQSRLHLRSSKLRKMILLMPSLLGASLQALDSRIIFWMEHVGLTQEELQCILYSKPSLLQYSVDKNLQPKLNFFTKELQIDSLSLKKMTISVPDLWGRSQQRFLQTMTTEFISESGGDVSTAEFGQILVRVPQLLRYSSATLKKKYRYFKDRLGLTNHQFKDMIQQSPRILLQSIPTMIEPKVKMLESAGVDLRNYPSALALARSELKKLILSESGESIATILTRRSEGQRRRRRIWLISDHEEVVKQFNGVAEAAQHAATSPSNMYNAIRKGRMMKGRKYVYAQNNDPPPVDDFVDYITFLKKLHDGTELNNTTVSHLTIRTAGRAFPPQSAVRGRRRAGGIALQVSGWDPELWRKNCAKLWNGRKLRLLHDGQTLILEYPILRPSRNRCSLFACEEAIWVASNWILHTAPSPGVTITIEMESSYTLDLLQNTTQLLEWGCIKTKDDFITMWNDCFLSYAIHEANPDILYPLSQQFYNLMMNRKGYNIDIKFVLGDANDTTRRLRDGARLAARLCFDSRQ